ncbi:MAG: hypothetical protein FJY76_00115 [Candidatus Aenigmarchaeota archaeon]|nr:hypothetical protein [Candidatus Aenigmarchaeota archaeon]
MKETNDEIIRKGFIEAFEIIRKLDENPELLKKLPKKSVVVECGKKRIFVPAKDASKIVVI